MKTARQNKIIEIITKQDVSTQNQLMDALKKAGINSTQATLSRDIKELRIIKELTGDGQYRYVLSSGEDGSGIDPRLKKIFRESVISNACAQNIVVLKTLPGLASAACSALDNMDMPDLVGTIAGDDTAFVLLRDTEAALRFCDEIEELL